MLVFAFPFIYIRKQERTNMNQKNQELQVGKKPGGRVGNKLGRRIVIRVCC